MTITITAPTAFDIARKELNAAAADYALFQHAKPALGSRPWFGKSAAIDRLLAAQAAVDAQGEQE